MKTWGKILGCSAVLIISANAAPVSASEDDAKLTPLERLGEFIFFDKTLSINENQSCATCHDPEWGWTGPLPIINEAGAVYPGSIKNRTGNRKPPTSAYATPSPIMYTDGTPVDKNGDDVIDPDEVTFVGGLFWDGRAAGWELSSPAAEQARGPFLNPVEQALPDSACVVYKVCTSMRYGDLYQALWSEDGCVIDWPEDIEATCASVDCLDDPDCAVDLSAKDRAKSDNNYDRIALSIAAFEDSPASNPFTSKLDAVRAGVAELTAEEALGRDLFRGKAMCTKCHVGSPGRAISPLFTDFTYSNLGVPKNPLNPVYGSNSGFVDLGLQGFLETVPLYADYAQVSCGKQKVPTLRNVAKKPGGDVSKAYMHNGFFKTLEGVVMFYNKRDVWPTCTDVHGPIENDIDAMTVGCWPAPEADSCDIDTINRDDMGDLGLDQEEVDAIVAFMEALSDGYWDDDDDGRPGKGGKD